MGWIIAILTASPALLMAETEEIVGTWRRADMSIVEFKTDGIVATEAGNVGKWERLGHSAKYLLRFTGAKDQYFVTVGSYKRLLTMEQQFSSIRTTLERVDNGPTQNFDVPDQKGALEMEKTDLQTEIDRISVDLPFARQEATQLWRDYEVSRALRRATGLQVQAKEKDAQIRSMEHRLTQLRRRIEAVNVKLASIK